MAIVVEDGTGFSNAQSYSSVTAADTYHAARGNASWAALAVTAKEQALVKATDAIDDRYATRWHGDVFAEGQALDWPRSYVPFATRNSTYMGWAAHIFLPETPLPNDLLRATAELALKSSQGINLAAGANQAVKRKKIGPFEIDYHDVPQGMIAPSSPEFAPIDLILAHLIRSRGNIQMVRG